MHELNYDWDATVTRVYQEIVGGADPELGTTRQEAFNESVERLQEMVANGELFIDTDRAIRASLSRADDQQGRAADGIIKRLVSGEVALEFDGDPALDTVVVLGDGKRKTWRYVTALDLREMDTLRYQNVRQQQLAYEEWRKGYDRALAAVLQHGTVGDAYAAGAFDGLADTA